MRIERLYRLVKMSDAVNWAAPKGWGFKEWL